MHQSITYPVVARYSLIQRVAGFTLIELMIVVAIIGILSSIAYPSYVESVRKSKRSDARAQLVEVASFMQKFYSQNDRFDQANNDAEMPIVLPLALTTVPRGGAGTPYYKISFVADSLTKRGFTLQAVPNGSMAGDKCGALRLNQVGQRTVSGASASMTAATCWK